MFGDLVNMMSEVQGQTVSLAQRVKARRQKLIESIAQSYPDKKGSVLLFAPAEPDHSNFIQESSFYYFSEISEPAVVLSFGFGRPTTLFQPNFGGLREKWMQPVDVLNDQTIILYGIDQLQLSGAQQKSYSADPYFSQDDYLHVIEHVKSMIAQGHTIFTLYPEHGRAYASVKFVIDRLAKFIPNLMEHVVDISSLIVPLRRKKDMSEIEKIYEAIAITDAAFQAAAHVIRPGAREAEIHAAIDYIFTENQAVHAYTPIVAGGKRATVLHYKVNNDVVQDGEMVLIDAGAMFGHYCADITRVFPASGKFSKRQKELYSILLDTQLHVAEHVRPGVWLINQAEPENSLQHIALGYLKKYGYDQYFTHLIGHSLGLDVHDVGGRQLQLQEGDVITIEPGIYIPEEGIGFRIEDNYWVLADTEPVCMSEDIPKTPEAVEAMVEQHFE